MDALVFDAQIALALDDMPISHILYWYERAVVNAKRRKAR